MSSRPRSFDRTYEGLKLGQHNARVKLFGTFDRTYEGLKPDTTRPPTTSSNSAFDRTYEGLKLKGQKISP